ncbi:MAG: hypothetical protein L0I76_07385 [Pseudonocardia sp.]|nr:hypothetical protein [Pseudonocardia sp.]
MTAPRQARHRLADPLDIRARVAPVEPPTQVLPIIPSQRAAVPQVFPAYPPVAVEPVRRPSQDGAASFAVPFPPAVPRRPARAVRARRGPLPVALAGVTVLVLALGVVVVVVESGPSADTASISGE